MEKTQNERTVLFVTKATPEDNEFNLWLQSKLIVEEYNCECDLSFKIGGEAGYWKSLQDFLALVLHRTDKQPSS